jgi:hypothetical protein
MEEERTSITIPEPAIVKSIIAKTTTKLKRILIKGRHLLYNQ